MMHSDAPFMGPRRNIEAGKAGAAGSPVMVMIGGRWTSLATRRTALRDRYAPARRTEPLPPAYRP